MKKLLDQDVREYFHMHGCELLSSYIGNKCNLKYRCLCGNETFINFNKFKSGQRCKLCGRNKQAAKRRTDFKKVECLFKKEGCILLSEEYINANKLLDYICKCGSQSKISYANFKAGHRCWKCWVRCGEKNNRWNPNREAVKIAEVFRKRCYSLVRHSLEATGKRKKTKTIDMLGYTPSELREHIVNHSNWQELKDVTWHLDHVFPIKAFLDYGIKDLKLINSLDNLRPVSSKFNLRKQGIYSKQEFERWLQSKGVI